MPADDRHHWPLGKHSKGTLNLDSPVLPVTRTDIGNLKRLFSVLLFSLCYQHFSDEIWKSQTDKAAGSIYFVPFSSLLGSRPGLKRLWPETWKYDHIPVYHCNKERHFQQLSSGKRACETRSDISAHVPHTCCTFYQSQLHPSVFKNLMGDSI